MAFDLNKLREAKNEVKSSHVRELREYLDTEEFEDKLQDFLMASVTGGESDARIELEVSKQDSSSIRLRLLGMGNGFNSEVDKKANFYVDLCEDSEAKIGDLNRYSDIISEKLRGLGLDVSLAGASPENFATDRIAENNMSKRVFVVDLEKLISKDKDVNLTPEDLYYDGELKSRSDYRDIMVDDYLLELASLRATKEHRDECSLNMDSEGYMNACGAIMYTEARLKAMEDNFKVSFPNEDLKLIAEKIRGKDIADCMPDELPDDYAEPDLGPDY